MELKMVDIMALKQAVKDRLYSHYGIVINEQPSIIDKEHNAIALESIFHVVFHNWIDDLRHDGSHMDVNDIADWIIEIHKTAH